MDNNHHDKNWKIKSQKTNDVSTKKRYRFSNDSLTTALTLYLSIVLQSKLHANNSLEQQDDSQLSFENDAPLTLIERKTETLLSIEQIHKEVMASDTPDNNINLSAWTHHNALLFEKNSSSLTLTADDQIPMAYSTLKTNDTLAIIHTSLLNETNPAKGKSVSLYLKEEIKDNNDLGNQSTAPALHLFSSTDTTLNKLHPTIILDDIQMDDNTTPADNMSHHTVTQNLHLKKGWNLVSFYVKTGDMRPETVFESITGNGENPGMLLQIKNLTSSYDPSIPSFLNTLGTLNVKDGYWIRVSESVDITITGSIPKSTDIDIKAGWNLVGYPKESGAAPDDEFDSLMGTLEMIKNLTKAYNPQLPSYLNTLTLMKHGLGYWLKVTESGTWTVSEDKKEPLILGKYPPILLAVEPDEERSFNINGIPSEANLEVTSNNPVFLGDIIKTADESSQSATVSFTAQVGAPSSQAILTVKVSKEGAESIEKYININPRYETPLYLAQGPENMETFQSDILADLTENQSVYHLMLDLDKLGHIPVADYQRLTLGYLQGRAQITDNNGEIISYPRDSYNAHKNDIMADNGSYNRSPAIYTINGTEIELSTAYHETLLGKSLYDGHDGFPENLIIHLPKGNNEIISGEFNVLFTNTFGIDIKNGFSNVEDNKLLCNDTETRLQKYTEYKTSPSNDPILFNFVTTLDQGNHFNFYIDEIGIFLVDQCDTDNEKYHKFVANNKQTLLSFNIDEPFTHGFSVPLTEIQHPHSLTITEDNMAMLEETFMGLDII